MNYSKNDSLKVMDVSISILINQSIEREEHLQIRINFLFTIVCFFILSKKP